MTKAYSPYFATIKLMTCLILSFLFFVITSHSEASEPKCSVISSGSGGTKVSVSGKNLYSVMGESSPVNTISSSQGMRIVSGYRMPGNVIYNVTFLAGSNGQVSGETSQTVHRGKNSSSVTAIPNDFYHFTQWSGDHSGKENPLTIANISADIIITANFSIDTYTVNFNSGGNGTVSGETSQTITHGSNCQEVTAEPSTGYHFTGWAGDYSGTENPLTLTDVISTMNLIANFAINQYLVEFTSDGNGIISGETKQNINYEGSATTVTAEPTAGYHFTSWSGDYIGTENPLTLTNVKSNKNILAKFVINQYTVHFASGDNGKITGVPSQKISHGGDCSAITAEPSNGYHFNAWSGDYTGAENPLTIKGVTREMNIVAKFVINTYTLIIKQAGDGNGTVNPAVGTYTSNYGTNVTITATPAEDSIFKKWSGDASSTEKSITVMMDKDMSITANFAKKEKDPPLATLNNAPPGLTNKTDYLVTVGGIGVITYKWKVDENDWVGGNDGIDVKNAISFGETVDGKHTLYVIGKDAFGYWQDVTSATTSSWTLDSKAPAAKLSNYPIGTTGATSINVMVSGDDVKYYKYKIDNTQLSKAVSVSQNIKASDLLDGDHKLMVIAMDSAGNWQKDSESTQVSWKVDTTTPTALLSNLPDRITRSNSISITVSGDNLNAYKFRLDNNQEWVYATMNAKIEESSLGKGTHTLYVNAYRSLNDKWQDGGNGDTTNNSTRFEWTIDLDKPDTPSLNASVGDPAHSVVQISWKTTEDGLKSYRIWYSKSQITEATIENDTETYCNITPGNKDSDEIFNIKGLMSDTTYYFAVKSIDAAGNLSELSTASCKTDSIRSQISDFELISGGKTADNSVERDMKITGSDFVALAKNNLIRFVANIVYDVVSKQSNKGELIVTIPKGIPAGEYRIRVVNKYGISELSTMSYKVTEAPEPLPEVFKIEPMVGTYDKDVSVTITGNHLSSTEQIVLESFDGKHMINLASIVVESTKKITAVVPSGYQTGTYYIQVHNKNGSNKVSAIRYEIHEPVELANAEGTTETSSMIKVPENGIIPIEVTLKTDDRIETDAVTDFKVEIRATIEPDTKITTSDNKVYTKTIDPPRQIPADETIKAKLGRDSLVFTMGNNDEKLVLEQGKTIFVELRVTLTTDSTIPYIYYLDKDGNMTLAGIDGEHKGNQIKQGGTILSQEVDVPEKGYMTYTYGLLLNHMSTYVFGNKTEGNGGDTDGGTTDSDNGNSDTGGGTTGDSKNDKNTVLTDQGIKGGNGGGCFISSIIETGDGIMYSSIYGTMQFILMIVGIFGISVIPARLFRKKRIMIFMILVLILNGLMFCQLSLANEFYMGVYGFNVFEDISSQQTLNKFSGPIDVDFKNGAGIQIRGGYIINDHISLEAMLEYVMPGIKADLHTSNATGDYKLKVLTFTANGKFTFPELSRKFSPYIIFGTGMVEVEEDIKFKVTESDDFDRGIAGRLGAGVDIPITANFSLGIESSYITGSGAASHIHYSTISTGAIFNF